jgi:UDPglucose--hexose-1-phosphate uridylyltransferase
MSDLRKDPIVGRWVIIAKNRARRPSDYFMEPKLPSGRFCPFCPGHEDKTPGEILAYRNGDSAPNGQNWRVRVVPNKFPALQVEGDLNKQADGIYDTMCGVGAHEVIVESPQHVRSSSDLTEDNLRDVFSAYRDRLVDLKRDSRLVYGMIFKNVGAAAGATLEHTHSQLIVTPIVPINVQEEISGSLEFYRYRGRCVYCDLVQQELAAERRVVLDTPRFVAISPFASRFPFETWIVPKRHSSHYENIQRDALEDLAATVRRTIGKIEAALDRPAYNYIIHTAPFDTAELGHYHWHLEIIPRMTKIAGFEWGAGIYINPVPPEDAAAFLRQIEPQPPQSTPSQSTPTDGMILRTGKNASI